MAVPRGGPGASAAGTDRSPRPLQLLAEPARLAERRRIAKDKRPRPTCCPASARFHTFRPRSGQERGTGCGSSTPTVLPPRDPGADGIRRLRKPAHARIESASTKRSSPRRRGRHRVARRAYLVDPAQYDSATRRYCDLRRAVVELFSHTISSVSSRAGRIPAMAARCRRATRAAAALR